jgi:putative transposase
VLKVVHDEAEPDEASGSVVDEIVREAARQMLVVALQAEVSAYVDAHAEEVDENSLRLVVRNGHHNEREVITAAGPVPVRAPRVNDERTDPATGERKRFASAILPGGHASRRGWPRWCRCCSCTACPARISVRR